MGLGEGELQKWVTNVSYLEGDTGYVFKPDMLDKLDSAKKEAPIWWTVNDRIYKWKNLTNEQKKTATILCFDDTEDIQWFKKWFGDPS